MKAEVLAVQKMTNGMQSAGMDEAQALAVVEAMSEAMHAFGLTREAMREELAPIRQQLVTREEIHSLVREELAPIRQQLVTHEEIHSLVREELAPIRQQLVTREEIHSLVREELAPIRQQLVTREEISNIVHEELAPITQRLDGLETRIERIDKKFEAKFDLLSGRLFFVMVGVLGAVTAMFGTMFAMLISELF